MSAAAYAPTLGLLMARGGSKRIPGKNIRSFAGKPILLWPLQAMRESGLFAKIIVSSDDAEIIRIARKGGAEAPFVRPQELAGDHATTMRVVRHAVEALAAGGENYASVCCVYGTSVFLTRRYLREASRLLTDAEAVMSVMRYGHPVQRGFPIRDGKAMFPPKEIMNARTQDLEPHYHDAGMLYWLRTAALAAMRDGDFHISALAVAPLIVSRRDVQDIDDGEDWVLAERMFAERLQRNGS